MELRIKDQPAPFSIYELTSGENVFELSTFGAQLISWRRGGIPIIFDNPGAMDLSGRRPIRGGAPICFPYFGRGTLLPNGTYQEVQHGLFRTTQWTPEILEDESAIRFRGTLAVPQDQGRAEMSIELTYIFTDELGITAKVINEGPDSAPFQLAIHTYWACDDPSAATVEGLGSRFLDNFENFDEIVDPEPNGPHPAPYDRVYLDAADLITLTTESYQLEIETQNGRGAVLWNPGTNPQITDLSSSRFVCVENGVITPPPVLAPGETYELQARYRVR